MRRRAVLAGAILASFTKIALASAPGLSLAPLVEWGTVSVVGLVGYGVLRLIGAHDRQAERLRRVELLLTRVASAVGVEGELAD